MSKCRCAPAAPLVSYLDIGPHRTVSYRYTTLYGCQPYVHTPHSQVQQYNEIGLNKHQLTTHIGTRLTTRQCSNCFAILAISMSPRFGTQDSERFRR